MTGNVNGLRAAHRRCGVRLIADSGADVVCLQEVRATDGQVAAVLADAGLSDWHVALGASARAGHAGVALLSRTPLDQVSTDLGPAEFADQGRWIEATVADPAGGRGIRVASAYVHKGAADGDARSEKDRFLRAVGSWLARHRGDSALLGADLNVAHTPADIRNWRGNRGRPGFLESERAHLDQWYAAAPQGLGWTDLGRHCGGDGPGPFTWWSWRGRAFDTDAGWRIDVVLASPRLARRATGVIVHRAPNYAARCSDHAAVSATFD